MQDEIKAQGTEAKVCADIAKRQQFGLNKYGVSVASNPLELREWLQHAYEESLDLPIYLKRAIDELDTVMVTPAPKREKQFDESKFDRTYLTVLAMGDGTDCAKCAFTLTCNESYADGHRPLCTSTGRGDKNHVYFVNKESIRGA